MVFGDIGTTLSISPEFMINTMMFLVTAFGLFFTIRVYNKKMFEGKFKDVGDRIDKKADMSVVNERCKVMNKRIDEHVTTQMQDMKEIKTQLNLILGHLINNK